MINLFDYCFLSWWIANLGVDPLVLFAAFLLVPCLTFLAALLLRVTRVLETIFYLLSKINISLRQHCCGITKFSQLKCDLNFSDLRVLPNFGALVKIVLFVTFLKGHAYADAIESERGNRVLKLGQVEEITMKGLRKYSIGHKKTLRGKIQGNSLYIKAIGVGHSDLLLWKKGSLSPEKIQFTVWQQNIVKKTLKLKRHIESIGLKAKIINDVVEVSGILSSEGQYKTFVHLHNRLYEKILIKELSVDKMLQKKIYNDLIYLGLQHFQDDLDCDVSKLFIHCYDLSKKSEIKKKISDQFLISWLSKKNETAVKQLKIKLRLFQFENLKGRHFSLGLNSARGLLKSILSGNPLALIENNEVMFNKVDYQFSTLAEPTIIGRLNHPIKVKLGSDIPYVNTSREGQTSTQWRFAGLNINLTIKKLLNGYTLLYKSGLSRPTAEDNIQSNFQESSLFINSEKPFVMFEIGFLVKNQKKSKLPIIEHVPLIHHLFSSYQNEKVFKKVIGIIEIKELHAR